MGVTTPAAFTAHACHHVGVRVSDLPSAVRFYAQALGGTQLTRPFTLSGAFPERIYGAGPGATVKVCHVGFAGGSGVELFEFVPARRRSTVAAADSAIMHAAFRVPSVPDAVSAVVAAGGALVGEVVDWGGKPFAYCGDLDGNILELAEVSFAGTVDLVEAVFPGSKIEVPPVQDAAIASPDSDSSESASPDSDSSDSAFPHNLPLHSKELS